MGEQNSPIVFLLDQKPILILDAEINRDLADISGTFYASIGVAVPYDLPPADLLGKKVEIFLHGIKVLSGWVEHIQSSGDASALSISISGRDVTGDLADCAVNPNGPLEWRKIKLEKFASDLIKPFGISLENQVDTGDPFELIALNPSDTILGAIEAQSRQRGILITSDGIGGMLLTKSGADKTKDMIGFPSDNVQHAEGNIAQRFSDYYVKGQSHNLERPAEASLNASLKPGQTNFKQGSKSPKESELSASCRFGHAIDDGVKRYRPAVFMAKTQSGGSQKSQNTANPSSPKNKRDSGDVWTLNDQAAFRMRTNRAHAASYTYTLLGFLNRNGELWRPNQIVPVEDDLNGVNGDMLISAVSWSYGDGRCTTRLSVVPLDAFDLTGDMDKVPKSGQRRLPSGRR